MALARRGAGIRENGGAELPRNLFQCFLVVHVEPARQPAHHGPRIVFIEEGAKLRGAYDKSARHGKPGGAHPAETRTLSPGNRRSIHRQAVKWQDHYPNISTVPAAPFTRTRWPV